MRKKQIKTAIILALALAFALALGGAALADSGVSSALGGAAKMAGDAMGKSGNLLNINTASADQLGMIQGLNPDLGKAIVAYRVANGDYGAVADLIKVDGIDSDLLSKIKPFLTVK